MATTNPRLSRSKALLAALSALALFATACAADGEGDDGNDEHVTSDEGALAASSAASGGLYRPAGTVLNRWGFSTGPEPNSAADFNAFYTSVKSVVGAGAVVRTGLAWDPASQDHPNFDVWSTDTLAPAIAKGVRVLPNIHCPRLPTDPQWTNGLRAIVRMYGPGGTYASTHAGFAGLTDFELWNEPNMMGDLGGTMTAAKADHLIKIGAAAIRAEASSMNFRPNVIGFAVGGIDVDYVTQLWKADHTIFASIDTLTVHAYSSSPVATCSTTGPARTHCIQSIQTVRDFLDGHGGSAVHLGTTEGGYAGSSDACRPPNVFTEQVQSQYSADAIRWLRARPALKIDFWMTYHAVDATARYSYACGSGQYDATYWKARLGVVHPDGTLKLWGTEFRDLINGWR